jgi:nuclear pore complex protein Nup205
MKYNLVIANHCISFLPQTHLHSGKTSINNQSVAINADFARQVVFLSQHLDCSERYVAAILHRVMVENPNMGPIYCLEAAIAEFHQRRRHLVDSLRFIFEAAETASMSGASPVYTRIDTFVRQELVPAVPVTGGEISLAYRIFKEIGSLENVVSKAQEAKQRAGSTSCDQGMWVLAITLSYLDYRIR